MTTTKVQFEQRLAELTDDWLTREQLLHLADISYKTLWSWLRDSPFPEADTKVGERNTHLYRSRAAASWLRAKLFASQGTDTTSGPRLAAVAVRMTYAPGERWRWTDIARRRNVTPGAVSNLGKAYEQHDTHPFPKPGGDNKRSAEEVSDWFLWYDRNRPGYTERGTAETAAGDPAPVGRVAEVSGKLRAAALARQSVSVDALAAELGVTADVAKRYLAQAEAAVMPGLGLVARNKILDLAPAEATASLTARQRIERVKSLLRRIDAPASVLTVGTREYFNVKDIKQLLSAAN
jgi:hypothetical protein